MRPVLRTQVLAVTLIIAALLPPAHYASAQDTVQSSSAVSPDSADAIRASLERPPPKPPRDALDYATLPFQIIILPLRAVGYGLSWAVAQAAQLAAPEVPGPIARAFRAAGLQSAVGTIGPRSGLAAQLRWVKLNPVFMEGAYSIRQSARLRGGLSIANPFSSFEAAYTFQRNAQPHFYGIGPDTREEDRTDYLRDIQSVAGTASGVVRFGGLYGDLGWEDNRVGRGKDGGTDDLQDRPGADTLFGLNERLRYVRGGLSVVLDRTYQAGFQRRGVLIELGGAIFRGVDGSDSDFNRVSLTAAGYIPLNPRQQLAIQVLSQINREDGGQGIPFYHLARLGDRLGARSLPQNRFRDRDMAAVMGEWRYEIWRELHERARAESFIFFDTGGVKSKLSKIRGRDLVQSYGFGFRVISGPQAFFVTYLAFGDEGPRARAVLDVAF